MTQRSSKPRILFEFLVVAICILTFVYAGAGILASLLQRGSAGKHDFVEYWAAGQQLAHHANPYDGVGIRSLEASAGFPSTAPTLYLGNPPSALLLVLPLGYMSATAGEFLWELLLILSLIASVQLVRDMYGRSKGRLDVLAYGFAPVLTCLLAGQIAILLLLGLVLFLRLHRSHPFFAGTSLWLCLLKPHLFLPFGIVLIFWILWTRSFRVLGGTVVALAFSSSVATVLYPSVWRDYRFMMSHQRIDQLNLPVLSVLLRERIYPHTLWVQCLPAGIGCLWAICFFLKHRRDWNWQKYASILMLVSVLVAPYSWIMDQAILIPALLHGVYVTRSRTIIAVLALMSALLEIASMRSTGLYTPLYLWTAPAWLIWYLVAIEYGPVPEPGKDEPIGLNV